MSEHVVTHDENGVTVDPPLSAGDYTLHVREDLAQPVKLRIDPAGAARVVDGDLPPGAHLFLVDDHPAQVEAFELERAPDEEPAAVHDPNAAPVTEVTFSEVTAPPAAPQTTTDPTPAGA